MWVLYRFLSNASTDHYEDTDIARFIFDYHDAFGGEDVVTFMDGPIHCLLRREYFASKDQADKILRLYDKHIAPVLGTIALLVEE